MLDYKQMYSYQYDLIGGLLFKKFYYTFFHTLRENDLEYRPSGEI